MRPITCNNLTLGFVLLVASAAALKGEEALPAGQHDRAMPPGAIARLGIPPPFDADRGVAMAFSTDGKLLACGGLRPESAETPGTSFAIQILDGKTGKRIRSLVGHGAPVFSLAFSRSGGMLASAAGDGAVSVWSVADGDRRWTRPLFRASRVCFSEDAKHVFATDTEDRVWVLETGTGTTVRKANFAGEVVTSKSDESWPLWKTIEVSDSPGGTAIRQRDGTGRVRTIFFSGESGGGRGGKRIEFLPDGKTMVTVSLAGDVRYRDVLTGKEQPDRAAGSPIVILRERSHGSFRTVARYLWPTSHCRSAALIRDDVVVSIDGRSAKPLKTIFAWPPPTSWITGYRPFEEYGNVAELGRRGKDPTSGERWMTNGIACSHDGTLVALLGRRKANEHEIRIVDRQSGKIVGECLLRNRVLRRERNPYACVPPRPDELGPVAAAFSPDGERLAVAVQGEIRMCEVHTGKEIVRDPDDPRSDGPMPAEHEGRVDAVAFSPDGSLVATAGRDCMTRLWSARTGKELHRWAHDWVHGSEFSVAFSPDGKLLAFDLGGQADLVRCSDGQRLHRLSRFRGTGKVATSPWPSAIAFTPDARRLAVMPLYGTGLTWWDAQSGERLGQTSLELFDQDKPLSRQTYSAENEAGPVAFSPSLKWLGKTHFFHTLYFHWDTSTGKQALKTVSSTAFTSARFSPDENLLALAAGNEPIRVIDLRTGKTVRELKGPPGNAYPRAFLDDGRILVSDHDDQSTRFWDVDSAQEIYRLDGHRIRACSANGRYAASVSEVLSSDLRAELTVLSSTILIWDLRLLKEAARQRNRFSGKRRP